VAGGAACGGGADTAGRAQQLGVGGLRRGQCVGSEHAGPEPGLAPLLPEEGEDAG